MPQRHQLGTLVGTTRIQGQQRQQQLLAILLTSLLLMAQTFAYNNNYTFALIPKATNNPFFDAARDGCLYQARLLGNAQCLYIGPDTEDAQEQANIIRRLVDQQAVQGIAISVTESATLGPAIRYATQHHVPVVTYDSDAPLSSRIAYVGTDNRFFGQQLAKVLVQLVPTGGTYAAIGGLSSPNIRERWNGFQQALQEQGKWWPVPQSPADFGDNLTLAMQQMEYFASVHQPTAIVPLQGAPMRSGTWTDFVDRHRNVTLVCGDAMPNQLDLLSQSYVQGLVGQLPFQMGSIATRVLYNSVAAQKYPSQDTIGTNVLIHLQVPLVLPELKVDANQIGSLKYVGYILFGIVCFCSIACAVWAYCYRKIRVVQVAQPMFLIMVALGILIMSGTLVPLSFDDGGNSFNNDGQLLLDDSHSVYDVGICMSIPWLACLGFTTTFSALFSKTLRINRIFRTKKRFSRVKVSERDVMIPFLILFGANLLVLICWTVMDPLTYERMAYAGTDGWNRIISTYGACRSDSVVPYLVPLITINAVVLIIANWQAYEARFIESEFSESKYIGIAMVSMLQAIVMGIPILFVVRDTPQAFYLVMVFMIFIICMVILVVIFIPKIAFADRFMRQSSHEQAQVIHGAIRRSSCNSVKRSSYLENATITGVQTSDQRHLENCEPTSSRGFDLKDASLASINEETEGGMLIFRMEPRGPVSSSKISDENKDASSEGVVDPTPTSNTSESR